MRLDDLIADLRDESALWDALSTGSDEEAEAVRTVFAWSYRALSTHAARLFRLLGLHPGPDVRPARGSRPRRSSPPAEPGSSWTIWSAPTCWSRPPRTATSSMTSCAPTPSTRHRQRSRRTQQDAALRRVLDWYLHTADAAQAWLNPAGEHVLLSAPTTAGVTPLAFTDYNAAADWSEREQGNYSSLVRAGISAGLDQLAWRLAETLWNALSPSASYLDWLDMGRAGLAAAERCHETHAQMRLLTDLGIALRMSTASRTRWVATVRSWRWHAGRRTGEEARSLNLIGLIEIRTGGSTKRKGISSGPRRSSAGRRTILAGQP